MAHPVVAANVAFGSRARPPIVTIRLPAANFRMRPNPGMHSFPSALEWDLPCYKAREAKEARIIKTIDEIAFQTNLPAVNAALDSFVPAEAGVPGGNGGNHDEKKPSAPYNA